MQAVSRTSLYFSTTVALVLGAGLAVVGEMATPLGWPLGVFAFAAVLVTMLRKPFRRSRALRNALSEEAQRRVNEILSGFPAVDRERFETDVKIILSEWGFEGVDGVEVTDRMKIGVAAGAALLLHGRPEWELPSRQTVLFYPDRFDQDYLATEDAAFDGMAHQRGPVILSARAIEESWADPHDGSNVVLHELAHLLDYENEFADGVPSLIAPGSTVAWRELVEREMKRVKLGRSLLRRYAAKNPAEFFAVAVENFFERPGELKGRHLELHEALVALFNLDPASLREDGWRNVDGT